MTQVEIGKKILKSSGNMTMVIDNLEERGLVRRERSKEDRRYFTVHLRDAGKSLPVNSSRFMLRGSLQK